MHALHDHIDQMTLYNNKDFFMDTDTGIKCNKLLIKYFETHCTSKRLNLYTAFRIRIRIWIRIKISILICPTWISLLKIWKISTRIRIHFFQMWIRGFRSGSTITERWIRGSGSGSTFPKCGSQDPDPLQNEMDPKRWYLSLSFKLSWMLYIYILLYST